MIILEFIICSLYQLFIQPTWTMTVYYIVINIYSLELFEYCIIPILTQ